MGCTIVYSQKFIHSSKSKGTGFIMEEFIRATGTESSTANLKKNKNSSKEQNISVISNYLHGVSLLAWSLPKNCCISGRAKVKACLWIYRYVLVSQNLINFFKAPIPSPIIIQPSVLRSLFLLANNKISA